MNYLIFAHRVDIRVVSLDVPYLIDVPLPLPALKNAFGVDVDHKTCKYNLQDIKEWFSNGIGGIDMINVKLLSALIYWTDTGERKIQRANRSGDTIETIIGKGLHTVDGIVIDSTGRKVCITRYINIVRL